MKASATATIASPGGSRIHQSPALTAPTCWASCRVVPQDSFVGSLRPRKARVASMRMAADTESVVWARISGARFGRTWRRMTCQSPAPRAFARSTYGRASRVSVWARTSRAVGGQAVSPMATTTVRTPRCITLASADMMASVPNALARSRPSERTYVPELQAISSRNVG